MHAHWKKMLAIIILLAVSSAIAAFLVYERVPPPPPPQAESEVGRETPSSMGGLRALYYDSLAREYPNETLEETVVSLLEGAGYRVDVYVGANATLGPLEDIGEYDLVIIRAHGAYNGDPRSGRPLGSYVYTGLYMREAEALYGEKWVSHAIRAGLIAPAVIPPPGWNGSLSGLPEYVAVSPRFFEEYLGRFQRHPIIIVDGCYGLNDERLADIFLSHGARAFIAWKGDVTLDWSDTILARTVKLLVKGYEPSGIPELLGGSSVDPATGGRLLVVTGK